jgi:hypothetical protein
MPERPGIVANRFEIECRFSPNDHPASNVTYSLLSGITTAVNNPCLVGNVDLKKLFGTSVKTRRGLLGFSQERLAKRAGDPAGFELAKINGLEVLRRLKGNATNRMAFEISMHQKLKQRFRLRSEVDDRII